jgi:glycosyltransferase involved in cell wall biosynthesis
MLSAVGRVNPYTYREDPTLRHLIEVVPFGLPEDPPQHTQQVLKGVYRNITADDKVILWGGGIWSWFDAPTLIKAMDLIRQQRSDVRLFFMGINRPNRSVAVMETAGQVIALSKELGLYERHVFFNDWVPYEERQNYLLEADVGVSLHLDHVETRFAFRTRLLDYLWAGLPIVSTSGDVMSEALAAENLVYLVAPGDVDGVAQIILDLLSNSNWRADFASRFDQVAARYRWDVVTQPLVDFCAAPHTAPDKTYLRRRPPSIEKPGAWWRLPAKGWRALELGGVSGFLRQSREYLRGKIKKR